MSSTCTERLGKAARPSVVIRLRMGTGNPSPDRTFDHLTREDADRPKRWLCRDPNERSLNRLRMALRWFVR